MKKEHLALENEVNQLREEVLILCQEVEGIKNTIERGSWTTGNKKQALLTLQNLHTRLNMKIKEKDEEQRNLLESVKQDEILKEKNEAVMHAQIEKKKTQIVPAPLSDAVATVIHTKQSTEQIDVSSEGSEVHVNADSSSTVTDVEGGKAIEKEATTSIVSDSEKDRSNSTK